MKEAYIRPQSKAERVTAITEEWASPRWDGIVREYTPEDVEKKQTSLAIEHTVAAHGAEKFWELLQDQYMVTSLGALTGHQAVEQVAAGLQAIYVSGWQVAGDANAAGETYPDQSIYPSNSVPKLVEAINNALMRQDEISRRAGDESADWYAPVIADAEAGFGGIPNVYELTRWMIRAGAAAIHLEDQLSSAKKCGHMGGKVLIATKDAIENLKAARLAADVLGVPMVLIARTDADSAKFLATDHDPRDQEFLTGERDDKFYKLKGGKGGLAMAVNRGLAYAPYADLLWMETAHPNLEEAAAFARGIHDRYPGKLLAYNCSPSFNWRKNLSGDTIHEFQLKLAEMGYRYQFVTLAGFHTLNLSMFALAREYKLRGMEAYVELVQDPEFDAEHHWGYRAVKHQSFVGADVFDDVVQTVTSGHSSITAMDGSTEKEQF